MIRPIATEDELLHVFDIEQQSYPPEAAAALDAFRFRKQAFPDFFLIAIRDEQPVGMINGVRTDESDLSDEGVKGTAASTRQGNYFCVLTVAVNETHRRQGIGSALVVALIEQARKHRIEAIVLMCEEHLVTFYTQLGFHYVKLSSSTHGGIAWHEMRMDLHP